MTLPPQTLAALLGSRICHDLTSPLGAISNGVELLEMSGSDMGPEIALISESVASANARIRYFRVAFGAAAEGQVIGAAEIRSIIGDITRGSRAEITWHPDGDIPRRDAKLVFLMIQCLETAMPWGGRIEISEANNRWTLSGTSDRMKINTILWELLSRPDATADVGAAEIQYLLLPQMIRETGRALTLELSEAAVTAWF